MNRHEYDPVDLVQLAAGFALGCGRGPTVDESEALEAVARILQTEWERIPPDEWPGTWAYGVAKPLGEWIGKTGGWGIPATFPPTETIAAQARGIVAAEMASADAVGGAA